MQHQSNTRREPLSIERRLWVVDTTAQVQELKPANLSEDWTAPGSLLILASTEEKALALLNARRAQERTANTIPKPGLAWYKGVPVFALVEPKRWRIYTNTGKCHKWGGKLGARQVTHLSQEEREAIRNGVEIFLADCPLSYGTTDRVIRYSSGRYYCRIHEEDLDRWHDLQRTTKRR